MYDKIIVAVSRGRIK